MNAPKLTLEEHRDLISRFTILEDLAGNMAFEYRSYNGAYLKFRPIYKRLSSAIHLIRQARDLAQQQMEEEYPGSSPRG